MTVLSKESILSHLHRSLNKQVAVIAQSRATREEKARQVNALVNSEKTLFTAQLSILPVTERQYSALVLQYCYSVITLEYRHAVWPYEYMAFSRRIGELWEAFCSVAWDYPSRSGVKRFSAPDFAYVRDVIMKRINGNIGDHHKSKELKEDINILLEIIGEINMKEDEVFSVNDLPYVIDFKSGFGSNEKGNMLRLTTVGRAYKLWDHRTRLLLLVRQEENNNYLNVLRRTGLWEVYTGASAYDQISELTGADIQRVRNTVIDWRNDLSNEFFQYLKKQPTDLTGYLIW